MPFRAWLDRAFNSLGHHQGLREAAIYPLGACAFIWRRLMFRTTFIAATGSVGKSTATASLATMLSAHAPTNWTPGGKNNRFVLARTILRTRFRHRFTMIEVGTRNPGEMRYAGWMIAPDIVLMLRVLHLHSDKFPTLEAMAFEKSRLLGSMRKRGTAILNADDTLVMAMQAQCRGAIRTFGLAPGCFVTASDISATWPRRLTFRLHCGNESAWVKTNFPGDHMLSAVLGAAATALFCGVPLARAAAAMSEVQPIPGRMQPMLLPNGAIVLRDDFNASLPTLESALRVMRNAEAGRRVVVAGELLDTGLSVRKRARLLGQLVAEATDMAVFVGDQSHISAKAAIAGGLNAEATFAFKGIRETAAFLKRELRAGDLILLKGGIGRHIERVILAQFGSISCWVTRCRKQILCDQCAELKLVSILPPADTQTGDTPGGESLVRHSRDLSKTPV